jgi:hypothetical protein
MARTVNINLSGLKGLIRELPEWADDMNAEVANKARSEIVRNIKAGKTGIFPAADLPRNKASTLRRKALKGRGNQSLIDEGILTRTRKWSTQKTAKGHVILPPKERREIVKYLQDGIEGGSVYKILEIPTGFIPEWIKKLVAFRFRKLIKKHA